MTFYQTYQREREAYIGDLLNLILAKLERWQYELFHSLDEATTILLEAFQELCLDVLLHKKVGLALLFGELLHCSRDDVFLVDL